MSLSDSLDERLPLSAINCRRIEDEARLDVIDALIVSPNGLLYQLSILDDSRNRWTSPSVFSFSSKERRALSGTAGFVLACITQGDSNEPVLELLSERRKMLPAEQSFDTSTSRSV